MEAKEVKVFEKKPHTFHCNNRKYASRASEELTRTLS
jgi:hypothetical protein